MEVEGGVFHPGTLGHVSDEMFPSWAKDEVTMEAKAKVRFGPER